MGETIPSVSREHIRDGSQLVIIAGQPPVGGPHFATPQAPGFYESPIPDGNAIHSLEHGVIWISYDPAKLDAGSVEVLRDLWRRYRNDVIVSPRPDNHMAVALASWERLMRLDRADARTIEQFVKTNVNRAPEPGVRNAAPMNVPR
jgi:hypothetical protein